MSGVSIDDFGASFIHYLPGVIQTLNNTSRARLLPTGELKWQGERLEKKVHVRRNVAFTFTEDGGPIPAAGKQSYVPAKAYRKFGVGSVKVTDGILDNADTTEHAAITVVESELRGLLDTFRKAENFLFTRDGTGVVALLGATTSGATISVDDARMCWEGGDFTILDTDGSTVHATFTNDKINRSFNAAGEAVLTPTASVSAGSQAQNDYIVWGTGNKSMYGRAPTGLDALIDDGTGTFQAVNITTYNRYTSIVLTNSTNRPLTPHLLRQLMAAVKSEAGDDMSAEWTLLGNIWQGINFEEMYEGELRITESTKVAGIEIASFQSTMGKFNIVTDPDAPYGKLFLVDFSQITRAVQHELDWRKNGGSGSPGSIFQRKDNSLNHTATCLETYEYFIEQRNRCGKIENLTEDKVTALG